MLPVPRADFYAGTHPVAADVLLLVEVSDTTSRDDRLDELELYARHGVGEVWIVDLDNRLRHTCRQPRGCLYTEVSATAQPGRLAPQALPDLGIDGSQLLPA